MKIGLIGAGFSELGYEMHYKGPFTSALIKRLKSIIEQFKPEEVLTSAYPGAEMIWAWVAMGKKIPVVCVLSDPEFGQFFETRNKQLLENLKQKSKVISVASVSNIVTEKYRDTYIVDRSDLMIVVWDKKSGGRTHQIMMYMEEKDKETILINTNAISK